MGLALALRDIYLKKRDRTETLVSPLVTWRTFDTVRVSHRVDQILRLQLITAGLSLRVCFNSSGEFLNHLCPYPTSHLLRANKPTFEATVQNLTDVKAQAYYSNIYSLFPVSKISASEKTQLCSKTVGKLLL